MNIGSANTYYKYEVKLWLMVILFFVIGDMLTTGIGLTFAEIYESNPFASWIIRTYAMIGIAVVKVVLFFAGFMMYLGFKSIIRIGIPIGFILVGLYATMWNIYIILQVI